MVDPNAETGSQANASSNASAVERPTATPQGVVCLRIAQAGRESVRNGAIADRRAVHIEQVVVRELLAVQLF